MTDMQQSPTTSDARALKGESSKIGALAVVFGSVAWAALWISLSVTPWIIRANVNTGDLSKVYTVPLAIWSAVVVLHVIASVLGVVAVRRRAGSGMGITAVTMGLTGLAGLAIYFVATYTLLPVIA